MIQKLKNKVLVLYRHFYQNKLAKKFKLEEGQLVKEKKELIS